MLEPADLEPLLKFKDFKTTFVEIDVLYPIDLRIAIQAMTVIFNMCKNLKSVKLTRKLFEKSHQMDEGTSKDI